MIDGLYVQEERFVIRARTAAGSPMALELSLTQLRELHAVTAELLRTAEEARSWPWGEYENRKGLLPVRRES